MNVDLYFCDSAEVTIDDEFLLMSLPDDEVNRANRFRLARHRHTFCVAHSLLRTVLHRRVGCKPEELTFEYGPQGKPTLPGGPAFNLSHTNSEILLGVTDAGRIGVDIEQCSDVPDLDDLAQMCFSDLEMNQYQTTASARRISCFYRGWTRKEALIKALGGGLSVDLKAFSVSMSESPGNALIDGVRVGIDENWAIHAVDVSPASAAAVALDCVNFDIATHRCSADLEVIDS